MLYVILYHTTRKRDIINVLIFENKQVIIRFGRIGSLFFILERRTKGP